MKKTTDYSYHSKLSNQSQGFSYFNILHDKKSSYFSIKQFSYKPITVWTNFSYLWSFKKEKSSGIVESIKKSQWKVITWNYRLQVLAIKYWKTVDLRKLFKWI